MYPTPSFQVVVFIKSRRRAHRSTPDPFGMRQIQDWARFNRVDGYIAPGPSKGGGVEQQGGGEPAGIKRSSSSSLHSTTTTTIIITIIVLPHLAAVHDQVVKVRRQLLETNDIRTACCHRSDVPG
ncbi:hypothetical protein CDEST_12071 [Colletotrichum destructivum]|uniref:Uncharacterized protein n=1 Tax=Colletotrichum destructivum TaxID=34406 RepID=A0AAX4IV18_9PEZI|nr:hypothetical protein CDEST_12071 [Colletotrichum destructivum]